MTTHDEAMKVAEKLREPILPYTQGEIHQLMNEAATLIDSLLAEIAEMRGLLREAHFYVRNAEMIVPPDAELLARIAALTKEATDG